MAALDLLTPRERDCLTLVALGRCNKEVAATLGIARWTVKKHLMHAYAKLGVQTRTGAAVALWREGDRR